MRRIEKQVLETLTALAKEARAEAFRDVSDGHDRHVRGDLLNVIKGLDNRELGKIVGRIKRAEAAR